MQADKGEEWGQVHSRQSEGRLQFSDLPSVLLDSTLPVVEGGKFGSVVSSSPPDHC